MLISIITVNLNDKEGLEKTILSVQKQSFMDFEHIIIDGGSNDGSVHSIEKYQDGISYWISEPDKGIYNAMNKGIKVAKGTYLIFLNSRDVFYTDFVLEKFSTVMDSRTDLYYGDVELVNDNNTLELRKSPQELTFQFLYKRTIVHQAFFFKRALFAKIGLYNEHLKMVSDWEFIINAIAKHNASFKYIDVIVTKYDTSGVSSDLAQHHLLVDERKQSLKRHFPFFIKDYEKLKQQERVLSSNRFKMLSALEKSYLGRKLNSFVLRVLLFLLKGKRLKDL